MKINKKLFFEIHSWIGIKLSILFFVVCFSGTIATISHELDWIFNTEIRAKPQSLYASKNDIVDDLKAKYPEGIITFWQGAVEPYLCDVIYLNTNDQRKYVFVNPYTGEVQGDANLTIQRFFRDFHYFLFIPFQVGHFTVLIFGFMLFISTITALCFYKKWWRKLFELKRKKGKVVLFRSLHRLVGVWSIPFTILFSITGIWYFLERTNAASIHDISNTKAPEIKEINMNSDEFSKIHYTIDYDSITQVAQNAIPNLVVKDIFPPKKKTQPIYLTGKSDVTLVRNRANRIYINPITYEVVGLQNAKSIKTVTWLNDIADPLHFGYFGGIITKIIWFFAGLGISFLVGSGIWISLNRKIKNQQKVKSKQLGKWKYVNILVLLVMLGFMYYSLITRYSINLYQFVLISMGWIILILLSCFIFIKAKDDKSK